MLRTPLRWAALMITLTAAAIMIVSGQPRAVEAQQGGIIGGDQPPPEGGFGTFVFGGGSFEQLLTASECPEETATFFYNKPDGTFAVYIPAAPGVLNEEINSLFPGDAIPSGTIFTAKCFSLRNVLAPIDSVDIRVAESAPPQYFLDVVSGLPGGCAQFDRYDIDRSDTTITVTIWNLEPPPVQGIFCTMIYGYVQHHIALGADFQSGTAYSVHVNDVTRTFVAQ